MKLARLLVVLAAGCGEGSGTDTGTGETGGETAELPSEPSEPLSIERLDANRFIVERDAIVQLAIDYQARRFRLEKADKVYAIAKLDGESAAARLGLREGDVIRGVNNVEMTDRGRLQRAWNRVRRDGEVKLMLEREGAVRELEWLFADSVEDRVGAFRSSYADRRDDRTPAEYSAVVKLAQASLVEKDLHRFEIDRAVLQALRDHPDLGERRLANVWTARGSTRGVTVGETSIYTAFGIGRFDVVKGVGAEDVRSASSLRELIAAQADASELTIAAVRLDEPIVLRFAVVEGTIDQTAWASALEAWKKSDADRPSFPSYPRPRPGLSGAGSGGGTSASRIDTDGIKRVDETTFEIERKHLPAFSFISTFRQVRVIPSIKNGKPNGFKLYAIRPSSIYAHLGFKNGDTIHRINGVLLEDLAKVMRIEQSIRNVKSFPVEITRRGKPATLRYRVKR